MRITCRKARRTVKYVALTAWAGSIAILVADLLLDLPIPHEVVHDVHELLLSVAVAATVVLALAREIAPVREAWRLGYEAGMVAGREAHVECRGVVVPFSSYAHPDVTPPHSW